MRVLLVTASRHGSTEEIGGAIAARLERMGMDVVRARPENAGPVGDFDAVILGSAVYAGHWVPSAVEFARRESAELRRRPVWLFSSGPIGDPPRPEEDPVEAGELLGEMAAAGHVVFPGRLDKKGLSFGERAIVAAFRAPEGDFRDWDAIEAWAEAVGQTLMATSPAI